MTTITDTQINVLANECKELEDKLRSKKEELQNAITNKLTHDGKKHPLSSFVGKTSIYDRPHKWTSPKTSVFSDESVSNLDYLDFNGIMTGELINELYEEFEVKPYAATDNFYTFAIPEDWSEVKKGQLIPIHEIYELLIFKVE